jgi:hypothetical protein
MSMISASYQAAARRSPSLAALERDAALVRVSRVRRWMIAGAAALSAGFAALVSSLAPGHTLKPKSSSGGTVSASSTASTAPAKTYNRMPPLASPGDLGLQGPSSAPQSSSQGGGGGGAAGAAGGGPGGTNSQVTPDPTQSAQPNPAQAAPAPAPQPAPAPAVSGGS